MGIILNGGVNMKKIIVIFSIILLIIFSIWFFLDTKEEAKIIKEKRNYNEKEYSIAIFSGGCFWCMEPPFEKLDGVIDVISGYTGGTLENPTYKKVSSGETKHIESVKIIYDSNIISYNELLDVFWKQVNPTDGGGQFVDRGYQYTTAIFYNNIEEKKIAEESLKALEKSDRYDKTIVTPIRKASEFYKAEEYHQDYYIKNDIKYKYYRSRSGRDEYLDKIWK